MRTPVVASTCRHFSNSVIAADFPVLSSGDTVTLFGDPAGSIDLQQLKADGACIDTEVTIADVEIRGTTRTG